MDALKLAAAAALGALAAGLVVYLVMRLRRDGELIADLRRQIDDLRRQIDDLKGSRLGEHLRIDLRAQVESVMTLQALATRDNMDALKRWAPHKLQQIMRELGLVSLEDDLSEEERK